MPLIDPSTVDPEGFAPLEVTRYWSQLLRFKQNGPLALAAIHGATPQPEHWAFTRDQLDAANCEGSAHVFLEGQRVNLSIVKNDVYNLTAFQWGTGNRNNPLVPWTSIAADQRWHPFGSWMLLSPMPGIYIKVRVDDVGGAIKDGEQPHVDLLVGDSEDENAPNLQAKLASALFQTAINGPTDNPALWLPEGIGGYEVQRALKGSNWTYKILTDERNIS